MAASAAATAAGPVRRFGREQLRPSNHKFFCALVVGGEGVIARQVREHLSQHGILVIAHWANSHDRRPTIRVGVDLVIVLKDFLSHGLSDHAVKLAKKAGIPFVRTRFKKATMASALYAAGAYSSKPVPADALKARPLSTTDLELVESPTTGHQLPLKPPSRIVEEEDDVPAKAPAPPVSMRQLSSTADEDDDEEELPALPPPVIQIPAPPMAPLTREYQLPDLDEELLALRSWVAQRLAELQLWLPKGVSVMATVSATDLAVTWENKGT